jgi:hypothetical protein
VDEIVRVALYALVYREVYKARHRCMDDVLDDIETCPSEVSLALLIGSQYLEDADWAVLHQLQKESDFVQVARQIAREDPFGAEVLLHACPPNGRRSKRAWAAKLVERWDSVAAARRALRDEGLTASRADIEAVAVAAYEAATGKTHEEYLNEYDDQMFPEYDDLAEHKVA